MDDLFRFLLLRPANLPAREEVKLLEPSEIDPADSRDVARIRAEELLSSGRVAHQIDDLYYGETALTVRAALAGGPLALAKLRALVGKTVERSLEELVGREEFTTDERRLADTLVSTKLVSGSAGTDARGLAIAAQGYDAIRQGAAGTDPVGLRPLVMPVFGVGRSDPQNDDTPDGSEGRPTTEPASGASAGLDAPDGRREALASSAPLASRVEQALAALDAIAVEDFRVPERAEAAAQRTTDARIAAQPRASGEKARPAATDGAVASLVDTPWRVSVEAIAALGTDVQDTLGELGLDLNTMSLPLVLTRLHETRAGDLGERAVARLSAAAPMSATAAALGDYVGEPGAPLPTGHGSIRPVGVGALLMVKQHVLRYEGGDLAHVENVLKSEHLSRETRRLERTETTILEESERTKDEERDSQTTDRFSLKRETSQTVKDETEFKAGVSVDAKYGPLVEVKANADFGTKHSSEESAKQASEFSKDIVSRAVSKVTERVLERRTTTTISEFEEKYSHGFDNTAGTGNISGVYQWVDKVLQAQVYSYGTRMLFDVTVPEPATSYIVAQGLDKQRADALIKPVPFTLAPADVVESNYGTWGHVYDVTGLEAPPPPYKFVSKAFNGVVPADPSESSASAELVIEDGYQAKYALFQRSAYYSLSSGLWRFLIGSNWVDCLGSQGYFSMNGEVGSVAIAYHAYKVREYAATVQVFCERTPRAVAAWQLKTHAALTQGYLAKLQAYESELAEAAVNASVVISGRNPLWNQRIISSELRKQCVTLLTAQQFDAFGALELSSEGYPQPNLARSEAQMPYVRFFEQAFEWEHLVYFTYPYFWGWKRAWSHRMLLDDIDPTFADFLRAGAARVVFPVRPGFEAAVVHYLETGEIWNGGPPPDITDPMYVPIIKEIQESQGAPGGETAIDAPWLVRLPTTLVKLRPDDALPAWRKVGEDWQPA